MILRRLAVLAWIALVPALAEPLSGQQPPLTTSQLEALRRNPALVREYLRSSGLTPDQVRNRLETAGFPGTLLDAYLSDSPAQATAAPGPTELEALAALGLPFALAQQILPPDTGLALTRPSAPSRIFGVDAFRRTTTQFFPLLAGPVPPDYRLGPGDMLVLILTGDVELTHTLQVTREGFVLIPQVGQVHVANLTMDQLRDVLYTRLGRVYSGVRRSAGATTRFDLTVANLRANQVYVVGEVAQPGAYQVSGLGTVLTALYAAGGVTDLATLRRVELRRPGAQPAILDLYDYLLRGDTRGDVRLETGDVVFVGVHGPRVAVSGAVVREGVYEVTPGETLRDVLTAAGHFSAEADLSRVTVHRILPSVERGSATAARSAIDVELSSSAAADSTDSALPGGVVVPPLELHDGDSVVVHPLPTVTQGLFVGIAGAVRRPGTFPWREGLTLRDLVRLAGGPVVGADLRTAEIARMPRDRQAGQLADTLRVPLDSSYLVDRDAGGRYWGPPGADFPPAGAAAEVGLAPYDQVLLLTQPEFELQRTVTVSGEVRYPGTYALTRKDEHVTDLLQRAGGLRATAYPEGARFYRRFEYTGLGDTATRRPAPADSLPVQLGPVGNMDQVNLNLARALARPGTAADIVLQPGDSLYVPEYLPTVRVSGAVVAPSSVQYVAGRNARYYIENAGGFAANADEGRTVVRFANGSARTRSRFLFFTSWPEPGPGAEVFVPVKPARPAGNWLPVLATVASMLASMASVVIVAISTSR
jgi:protein involved in polysaccharide export with SLBB domain